MCLKGKIRGFTKEILYRHILSNLYRFFRLRASYQCPVCHYEGIFRTAKALTGPRKNAICPICNSFERHRIQVLVFKEIAKDLDTKKMKMLHFAPDESITAYFKDLFKSYVSADLMMENVDRKEDLIRLSFEDQSFDFVYASHVLEHIKDDLKALSEIRRVLRPDGIAILPVPIIGKKTVEYPEANPAEVDHVRCPGEDYYDRYFEFFGKENVKLFRSSDFDDKYQTYIYEDRTRWPKSMPLRSTVEGVRHIDIVPVCIKKAST